MRQRGPLPFRAVRRAAGKARRLTARWATRPAAWELLACLAVILAALGAWALAGETEPPPALEAADCADAE